MVQVGTDAGVRHGRLALPDDGGRAQGVQGGKQLQQLLGEARPVAGDALLQAAGPGVRQGRPRRQLARYGTLCAPQPALQPIGSEQVG